MYCLLCGRRPPGWQWLARSTLRARASASSVTWPAQVPCSSTHAPRDSVTSSARRRWLVASTSAASSTPSVDDVSVSAVIGSTVSRLAGVRQGRHLASASVGSSTPPWSSVLAASTAGSVKHRSRVCLSVRRSVSSLYSKWLTREQHRYAASVHFGLTVQGPIHRSC